MQPRKRQSSLGVGSSVERHMGRRYHQSYMIWTSQQIIETGNGSSSYHLECFWPLTALK
ncbi:unnamed protein product [Hymenolepis diminuta]|uniref:Uncharacterized protein n=1 Tax=Hymenolepis diminuta TaxID=6216 RepID=A0A564Y206_HYMDI|nr:unnamed protein product [Hymenolepis diminuta]